ncbi:hypothetical protein FB567DRAFT_553327 [Paraphoma chrysanthemicola]|uniref:F-box domain-containing protein n=1 Tax=Paraphoma chrysanthemicola TaxID=798071 RepID=A0A8K0VTB6_9PLEO|nr:hypothetical protein FB567DRAFT_553327 [Paraphoma chrysanthemicola]
MAGFLQLPQELRLQILELLEGDNAALVPFCSVSRVCAQLAHPVLYRHVVLGSACAKPFQIGLFLCTLFDRPDHAKMVRTLDIKTSIHRNCTDELDVLAGAADLLLANNTRLQYACVRYVMGMKSSIAHETLWMIRNWQSRLYSDAEVAYVGAVLALSTNVRDITMTIYNKEESYLVTDRPLDLLFGWVGDVDHSNPWSCLPVLPSMRNVTRLKIPGMSLSVLHLGFDALEVLEVDLTLGAEVHRDLGAYFNNQDVGLHQCCPPRLRSIVVHLWWYGMLYGSTSTFLGRFFEELRAPNLDHIRFAVAGSPRQWSCIPHATFGRLASGLKPIRNSLRTLTVDLDNEGDTIDFKAALLCLRLEGPPERATLQQFENLHTLKLPSSTLAVHALHHHDPTSVYVFNMYTMPPKLKHLIILHPNAATLLWLKEIFTAANVPKTGLELVTLLCAWDLGKPTTWFERRRSLLDTFPVRFVVRVLPGQRKPEGFVDKEVADVWRTDAWDSPPLLAWLDQ